MNAELARKGIDLMDVDPPPRNLTPAQALRKQELLEALKASTEQMRAWRNERRQLKEEIARMELPCKELTEKLDAQSSKHQEIIRELKSLS